MIAQNDRELHTLNTLEMDLNHRREEILRDREQNKSSLNLSKKSEGI